MASEATLDFEALLAPIEGESPGGGYLRDTDFDRFQAAKDARAQAVATERKIREVAMFDEQDLAELSEHGQPVDVPGPPDWRGLQQRCIEILTHHSKDLWIATWLIEANTRLEGFAGVRDGFQLTAELCERFWDSINPPRDEDEGYLDTVSQLTSLNGLDGPGTLIGPLEEVPLIPGHDALTFAAWREATERGGGEVTENDFDAAVRQVDLDRLRDQEEDLAGAIEAFGRMCDVLQAKCEADEGEDRTPPSSQILRTLESIRQAFTAVTRNVLAGEATEATEAETGDATATGLSKGSGGGSVDIAQAQVNNREDAFRMLMKASEFFRKTEPHSPVSYMLQQTVEFGRMDLPTLLAKLIQDEDVLKNFADRVGIPLREDSYEDD